jgi:RNA polymerase sigma-70 factor (ECF subfamily)
MDSRSPGHSKGVPPALAARHAPPGHFEQLYDEYFGFVWRNLRRVGVPAPSLDDATQDVFLVVHRRLPEAQRLASTKAWLAAIALRVASDYRRRDRRKGGQVPLSEVLVDGRPGPQEARDRAEQVERLDRLLARLEHHRREVFVLAELEGMTAPEISLALGTNVNTVYSRLRLARRDFEAALVTEGTIEP